MAQLKGAAKWAHRRQTRAAGRLLLAHQGAAQAQAERTCWHCESEATAQDWERNTCSACGEYLDPFGD